jgi:hypothetical protein
MNSATALKAYSLEVIKKKSDLADLASQPDSTHAEIFDLTQEYFFSFSDASTIDSMPKQLLLKSIVRAVYGDKALATKLTGEEVDPLIMTAPPISPSTKKKSVVGVPVPVPALHTRRDGRSGAGTSVYGARFHHGFCCVRDSRIGLRLLCTGRVLDRKLLSRMPLVPTPARLKLLQACDQ